MVFGYICGESTSEDFKRNLQLLKSINPDEVVTDKFTTGRIKPKGLNSLMEKMRSGDRFVLPCWEAAGRTAKQLLALLHLLAQRGIIAESLTEGVNMQVDNKLNAFVNDLVKIDKSLRSQATSLGMGSTTIRKGPKPGSYNEDTANQVALLYQQGRKIKDIMEKTDVGSAETIYRYLAYKKVPRRSVRKN